jgi:Luciferase-like monooxygenase
MNFDQIWLGDSVCILNRARGDCLTTMAALACKTDRIKIGTAPLIAALRNPVLLAHSLATLDVISQGRLSVAVSVAGRSEYNEREFIACGVPFRALRAVPVATAVIPPAAPAPVPAVVIVPPTRVSVISVAPVRMVAVAVLAEIAAQFGLVPSQFPPILLYFSPVSPDFRSSPGNLMSRCSPADIAAQLGSISPEFIEIFTQLRPASLNLAMTFADFVAA